MLYLHFHKAHEPQTYQSGDFGWGTPPSKSRDTKNMRSRDKTKMFISSYRQGPSLQNVDSMLTRDEVAPPKKSRNTSIL